MPRMPTILMQPEPEKYELNMAALNAIRYFLFVIAMTLVFLELFRPQWRELNEEDPAHESEEEDNGNEDGRNDLDSLLADLRRDLMRRRLHPRRCVCVPRNDRMSGKNCLKADGKDIVITKPTISGCLFKKGVKTCVASSTTPNECKIRCKKLPPPLTKTRPACLMRPKENTIVPLDKKD
ncbi:hypothetical protein QBC44DRAFT_366820 [Cladorrhinum sp. PSN332]|nr:hypothetical protein QBC44DRAFT_366820 [Cladorrhinum sp. PSN332]